MITVITGPMFSGKSRELFARIDRCNYRNKKYMIFKPDIDSRKNNAIYTRGGESLEAISIHNSIDILDYIQDVDLVVVDEIQFLDKGIVKVIKDISFQNKDVLLAGLDKDSLGNPFGYMPDILALADEVVKLRAVCHKCKDDASFSIRLNSNNVADNYAGIKVDVLEETDYRYEARCYKCFKEDMGKGLENRD